MARSKYKVANMADLPSEEELLMQEMENASIDATAKKRTDDIADTAGENVSVVSEEKSPVEPAKKQHVRSKRYQDIRSKIDRSRTYSLIDALELLKSHANTKFDQTVEVHLVCKEPLSTIEVSYPHSTGKTVRVEVFSDDTIAKLDKQQIDFDVLLATPAQMGKLTKYARLLGPKGLMPNPKNGTLVSDPEKRKKELESGKQSIRGEKKAPLVHTTVGKISMDVKALAENIDTLIKSCGQGKVVKATICTTMSPGVRISV